MNTADSESLARSLLAAGYVEETDIERADIAVLNTCVVRQASEEKVYGKLHELRSWKTPERTIAVTGCIVRKEGDTLQQRFPQLDRVVPIGEYRDFVAELDARYDISQGEPLPVAGRTGISAYLSIIEGCDHNCTFCIVPAVRGRERHKPGSQVLSEVRAAAGEGAREVVLLGQNVDDYRDPETGAGLAALLRRLETVEGLRRLRFMTSHPQDLEMELLDVMAGSRMIAHELQLPIQSGSDTMLKRMARGYQVRHYRAIIERARRLMPDLGLATDIIVGFPGETEAMFEDTLSVMRDLQFDVVHLAQYSPRPGTHAARAMTDDVPAVEKRRRINVALALQKEIAAFRTSRFVGRTVEVLVEGRDELGRPYGRNRQGKRVLVKRASVHPGELVQVLVEDSGPGQLAGPLAGARPELSLTSRA